MRTIKFRAWDSAEKIMWKTWFDLNLSPKTTITLLQFTGLLDKNGKEIYEGDIIFRKDDDLIDGNKTLIRGFQGYFEVVWHQGKTGLNDNHDCPVEICGFALKTIPGRFIRKPHIHVTMPERLILGREATDPILQEEGFEIFTSDTRSFEIIGNIYQNPDLLDLKK